MTEKTIVGEFRLVNHKGLNKVERSKNMSEAAELCFAGMIIEVLAAKHGVSQEKMTEILLDGNKAYPMTVNKLTTYVLCNDEQDCVELITINFDEIIAWGNKWIEQAYSEKEWKSEKENFSEGANVGIYWLSKEDS